MVSANIKQEFINNDNAVLSELYKSQFPKFEHFVLANSGNGEQARDIFQEAFIVLWIKIRSEAFVPRNRSEVNGYLYRVAKNKWLDVLRSNRFKKKITLEEQHDVMVEQQDDRERKFNMVEKGIERLGDKCRDILNRFYFKKESMADIAEAFGWTEASARNNKYRCIQQLRGKMDDLNL